MTTYDRGPSQTARQPPEGSYSLVFEAEGEGATPVVLVAILALLVLGAFCYLVVHPFE